MPVEAPPDSAKVLPTGFEAFGEIALEVSLSRSEDIALSAGAHS